MSVDVAVANARSQLQRLMALADVDHPPSSVLAVEWHSVPE